MKRILSLLALLTVMLPLFAYNPDFDLKYEQAKALYEKGQFEQARTAIKSALEKLPGLSDTQVSNGKQLLNQCNQAISNRDRLELVPAVLNTRFDTHLDSIRVNAGQPKLLSATSANAAWCKVDRIAGGWLYLKVEGNPAKEARETRVVVSMGKVKKQTLRVVQEARPETVKQVTIQSIPDYARISVDGGEPNTGSWQGKLSSGSHQLRLEKNGYAVKDTVIVLPDDLRSNEQILVEIPLQPQFPKILVEVTPEEGFSFETSALSVTMNGVRVSNDPREIYSYDDDRDIQRYSRYQDGTVPVSPGWVDIQIAAPGFETWKTRLQVKAQELVSVPVTLKAITGSLSLIDAGKAREAIVFLDGEKIGTVNDLTARRTMVGEHVITLEREGFLPGESTYAVTVRENEDTPVYVTMDRYNTLVVTSDPADARVTVDGEYIGLTPTKPYLLREKEPGHVFLVEVSKDARQTVYRELRPDFTASNALQEDFSLLSTHKFLLSSDEANLLATIKNGRRGDSTFVDAVLIPAELDLPYRQTPYYVELHRVGQARPAYRGRLTFKEGAKPQRRIQSWSQNAFHLLSGNLFLVGRESFQLGNTAEQKGYWNLGNASFAKLRLYDGISTSAARGSFFLAEDSSLPLKVQKGTRGDNVIEVGNAQFLPAISALFINGEFRVGGGIMDYLDVNAVVTYAWYPDVWSKFLAFSYISGHDLFVGAEVSSRFPYFNLNFKAGLQMYPGLQACIYVDGMNSRQDESFYKTPVDLPNLFVISLGFSLGGKDAKGNNIFRVF